MSCEICGRGNCMKMFHSMEEQSSYDESADIIKDKIKTYLEKNLTKIDDIIENDDGTVYVNFEEVMNIINNY